MFNEELTTEKDDTIGATGVSYDCLMLSLSLDW
jgi:hypothetical protein